MSSERPPKEKPPQPEIVFVGPEEEDAAPEKTAERLGETWTPEAVRRCKILFDQIEALTHARGESWQPEINVVLSKHFKRPLEIFRAALQGAVDFPNESNIWYRVNATLDSFVAIDPLHALRKRGQEYPVAPPFSPTEFFQILQHMLELLLPSSLE